MTSFVPADPSNTLQWWNIQASNVDYSISFTPSSKLFHTSKITISPPPNLILGSTCTVTLYNAVITKQPTCTKTGSGLELTDIWLDDGDANLAEYAGASAITVSIGKGTNPASA